MRKLGKIFFLSPSFFAIISGAFIGIATGILIDFIREKVIGTPIGIITVLLFFVSSGSLIYISMKLEYFKEELGKLNRRTTEEDLWDLIKDWQLYLWSSFWISVGSFGLGIVFIYRVYIN